MFYTTRHQTYCRSDTDDMVFASPLIRYHTQKKIQTEHTQGLKDWHGNIQGDPQKCPYFSLAITFTKIRKSSRFFLQLQEVYRILLVETTLESIMFYYTFSVINTMYDPCTGLLYDKDLIQSWRI